MNTPASRDAWKTLPMPQARARLDFDRSYDAGDFARIQAGLVPEAMEDKWFVFYETPWLYCHRSWTGFAIYALRFEATHAGARVAEAWVNRDPGQYGEVDDAQDGRRLGLLIDGLLRRGAVSPLQEAVPTSAPTGDYPHALRGSAQRGAPVRVPAGRSLWSRLREWMRG